MNYAPVAERPSSVGPSQRTTIPGPLRLLLVEPDEASASLLRRQLEMAHSPMEVTRASGALSALNRLISKPLDCILVEPTLPDATGLAACDLFLAHPAQLPVVVLTATADPALAYEARRRGVRDWLVKDVCHTEDVASAVQRAINCRTDQRQLRSIRAQLRAIEANVVAQEHRRRCKAGASDRRRTSQ